MDIGIVILSIVGIALEEVESKIIPINPTIIRVMRVMRIARGAYKLDLNQNRVRLTIYITKGLIITFYMNETVEICICYLNENLQNSTQNITLN